MKERGLRSVSLIFTLLVGATLTTFYLGFSLQSGGDFRSGSTWELLLLLAFVKVYLIFLFFMDVRVAPARLHGFIGLWLVLTGGGIALLLGGTL